MVCSSQAQCDVTRASIAVVSIERKKDLEKMESIRKKLAHQNMIINQLHENISFESDSKQRTEKKVSELRLLQEKLHKHQKIQEANILQ